MYLLLDILRKYFDIFYKTQKIFVNFITNNLQQVGRGDMFVGRNYLSTFVLGMSVDTVNTR